jgi:hypothetical protein
MRRHFLGVLQRAPIGEIGGNTRGAEVVVADRRMDADSNRTTADQRQASGCDMGCSDSAVAVCPREVRNTKPLRSSAMPAASI